MIKTTDARIKLKELDHLGYTSLGILPAEILSEIIYETKDLIKKTKNKFPKNTNKANGIPFGQRNKLMNTMFTVTGKIRIFAKVT